MAAAAATSSAPEPAGRARWAARGAPRAAGPRPWPEPGDRGGGSDVKRPLAYVALALGGAGLVAGGVTGAMAMSKRSALDDNPSCADGKCLHDVEDDVSSLRTFRTISTVGFIAGGV